MGDNNKEVRDCASKILIDRKEEAVEPLIRGLSNENKNIRENSVFLLIEIGDERAVEPLIKYLKTNIRAQPEIQENKT